MTQPPDLPAQDPSSSIEPNGSRRERASDATVPATGFAWVAGRTGRWVVLAAWLVAVIGSIALDLPAKFSAAETNEQRNFLPADAESTKAADAIEQIVDAEDVPLVAVVRREGGLTAADKAAIDAQLKTFNATPVDQKIRVEDDKGKVRTVTLEDTIVGPKGQRLFLGDVSKDGTTALVLGAVKVTGDSERLLDSIDALRSGLLPLKSSGLTVKVTGGAGFSYDAVKVFGNLNASLAGAAFLLVIVLLILIYRSPVLLFLPLLAVVFAELMSRSVGYLTTNIGVTVNGQSSSIMSILVLGAGTDYALLVVARYREELRHHENKHDALRLAMQSAGPAVFASGLTVAAGVLTLAIASVKGTAGLGPTGAIGVAVAMLSMLTLLPALFAVLPRGVFWPRTPKFGTEGGDATHGAFRRLGERIAGRPRATWIATAALLLVCTAGLTTFNPNLSQSDTFIGSVESVEGSELLAKSFPGGTSAPTQVIVPDAAKVEATKAALQQADGVASVENGASGKSGTILAVTLTEDPYSTEAQDLITGVREAARQGGGNGVLVGGDTAINYDLAKANARDLNVIIPIVLLVVFVILIGLLRAIVLPLVLIGTVVISFAAALGISSVLWTQVFGFAGADRSIVLFAFVFLVALGIDYNIFLASRIREEALRYGTREGILRGLGATGGVITAAGIVLAGTFLVLATTPVVFLVEIGTAIAIGVVLDTFIVRSILAPALSFDLGHRIWWPWGTKVPLDEDAPGALPKG
jgi:putative drug exporter of the RND superfamily